MGEGGRVAEDIRCKRTTAESLKANGRRTTELLKPGASGRPPRAVRQADDRRRKKSLRIFCEFCCSGPRALLMLGPCWGQFWDRFGTGGRANVRARARASGRAGGDGGGGGLRSRLAYELVCVCVAPSQGLTESRRSQCSQIAYENRTGRSDFRPHRSLGSPFRHNCRAVAKKWHVFMCEFSLDASRLFHFRLSIDMRPAEEYVGAYGNLPGARLPVTTSCVDCYFSSQVSFEPKFQESHV